MNLILNLLLFAQPNLYDLRLINFKYSIFSLLCMNCLVTGGAGFIGSHLVDRLLELGHSVTVLDNFSYGNIKNLIKHHSNQNLKIVRKSVCDDLNKLFQENKFDIVFHLAALLRVQHSIEFPEENHNVNVNGTFNLLNMCRKYNVKKFIFSSSCATYGDQEETMLNEGLETNPMSPYAVQKLIGEKYCKLFNRLYNIKTICLRYFNVYGPRQNPKGGYAALIPLFITKILNIEKPTINGDGNQTRDFVFVKDVVEANVCALNAEDPDCFGEVFNVGTGINTSVNEVTQKILELNGKLNNPSVEPIYGPSVVQPKDTQADISKIKSMLNWDPKIGFDEGMKKVVGFYSNSNKFL